jgi:hypothetical protein
MNSNTAVRASAFVGQERRSTSSLFSVLKNASQTAWTQPVAPIESSTPASRQRRPKTRETYCKSSLVFGER